MSKQAVFPAFQAAMDLGPRERGETAIERVWNLRIEIIHRVGPKEAAYQFDVSPTYLHDVLRRDPSLRKPWKDGWDEVLYAMADEHEVAEWDQIRRDIRKPDRTDTENLERLIRRVRERLGPAGEDLVKEALR